MKDSPVPPRASRALIAIAHMLCWALLVAAGCNGDGPSGTDGSTSGLVRAWVSPPATAGSDWVGGAPAVDGGRVFVQEANNLVGLDAESGRRLWTRRIRVAPSPPPTELRAGGGRVFVSETDSIMSIDGVTGATVWSVHPDSQAVVSPALDATGFYTGQRGVPVVYALDRNTGTIRWKVNVGAGYTFAAHVHGVAVSGDTVYAAVERYLDRNGVSSTGVLVALDRADGRELWRYETTTTKNYFIEAPLPLGTSVIVDDFGAGALVAIDVVSHREVWRTPVGGSIGVVLVGGTLLTASVDHQARALDPATGTVKWRTETGSSALGVGACGGQLWVSALSLRRYDSASGQITGESGAGGAGGFVTHLAGDGSRIYLTGTSGVSAFAC